MSGESLLIILLVGIIAGWLAGQIMRGTGFGLIGDLGRVLINSARCPFLRSESDRIAASQRNDAMCQAG